MPSGVQTFVFKSGLADFERWCNMNGHEYNCLERHTGIRRVLSSIQQGSNTPYWKGSRKRSVSSYDTEGFPKEPIQLLRFICGKQKETMAGSPPCSHHFHRPSTVSEGDSESQKRKASGQQAGKFGMDYISRKRNPCVGNGSDDSFRYFRREKSKSKVESPASCRDSGFEGNCRRKAFSSTLRGKSFCDSVHSSRQALEMKWPEDLRVQQFPS